MFEMENGVDHPLGARLDETGCHFCVWAPQSDKVELCLFDDEEQELARLPLPGRRGICFQGQAQRGPNDRDNIYPAGEGRRNPEHR